MSPSELADLMSKPVLVLVLASMGVLLLLVGFIWLIVKSLLEEIAVFRGSGSREERRDRRAYRGDTLAWPITVGACGASCLVLARLLDTYPNPLV